VATEVSLRKVLKEVRERGWAFSDQESEVGVRTVAAPLYGHGNRLQAAINVAGHASRVSMKDLKQRHLPVLLEAARRISRALGAGMDAHPTPGAVAAGRAGLGTSSPRRMEPIRRRS
jgi:DNA-binding IclR family transcriptional regulator